MGEDILLLELGELYVVFVTQWLRKRGAMVINWKNLNMLFHVGDTRLLLKRDPSLTRKEMSLKVLTHAWDVADQGFLAEFRGMVQSRSCQMRWF